MHEPVHDGPAEATDEFASDPAGLPASAASELVELSDGDRFELRIDAVAKRHGPVVWMAHCHIAEHHEERDDVQLQRVAGRRVEPEGTKVYSPGSSTRVRSM